MFVVRVTVLCIHCTGIDGGVGLEVRKIGDILRSSTERDTNFAYDDGESKETLFPCESINIMILLFTFLF